MGDELKPCPFCGGKPTFVHATSEDIGNGYVCRTLAVISCDHCMFDMTGETDDDAVVTWNARAERTCHMVPVLLYDEEGVDGIECDECGWSDVHEWYDPMPEFCPNCGAKVAGKGESDER